MISFHHQSNTVVNPNDLAMQLHWRRWERARETTKRADARLQRLRRLHLREDSAVLLKAKAEARAAHLAEGKEFRIAALSQQPWGTPVVVSVEPRNQAHRVARLPWGSPLVVSSGFVGIGVALVVANIVSLAKF